MSDSEARRKLATIVALDVAGYSARTEADEVAFEFAESCKPKVCVGVHLANVVVQSIGGF